MFGSFEDSDLDEAIIAAHKIGDEYLQKNV